MLEGKPAWRPTLSDGDGHLDSLARSIAALRRAGAQARQSDDAMTSQALEDLRRPASQALNDLAGTLARLVGACDAYLADAALPTNEGEPQED